MPLRLGNLLDHRKATGATTAVTIGHACLQVLKKGFNKEWSG
jgi:hypothetical protein